MEFIAGMAVGALLMIALAALVVWLAFSRRERDDRPTGAGSDVHAPDSDALRTRVQAEDARVRAMLDKTLGHGGPSDGDPGLFR